MELSARILTASHRVKKRWKRAGDVKRLIADEEVLLALRNAAGRKGLASWFESELKGKAAVQQLFRSAYAWERYCSV